MSAQVTITTLLSPRALTRADPQCVLCLRTIDQSEPAISPNGPMRGSVVSDYQEHNREHVFTHSGPDCWLPGSSPFLGQLTCQSSQSSVFMEITCPGHKIQNTSSQTGGSRAFSPVTAELKYLLLSQLAQIFWCENFLEIKTLREYYFL